MRRQAYRPGRAKLSCQRFEGVPMPPGETLKKSLQNGRTLNWNVWPLNANRRSCLCSGAIRTRKKASFKFIVKNQYCGISACNTSAMRNIRNGKNFLKRSKFRRSKIGQNFLSFFVNRNKWKKIPLNELGDLLTLWHLCADTLELHSQVPRPDESSIKEIYRHLASWRVLMSSPGGENKDCYLK